jgi:hypothetical protein
MRSVTRAAVACATILGLGANAVAQGEAARTPPRFRFVNVAADAGITAPLVAGRPGKDHLLDSAGAGAAWLDYDRDGRLDLYLVNGWKLDGSTIVEKGRYALYRGLPDGTFRDVTAEAGVGGSGHWASGAFAADYDGDGWTDLLVTTFGPVLLYRNLGNGRFEETGERVGLGTPAWHTGAAFLDADRDGDLDLYVAAYIDTTMKEVLEAKPTLSWRGLEQVAFGPFGLKGAPDRFYRNDGAGRFVEATMEAGLQDQALGFGFAVRALDYDDDGDLDVYVANDSDPNYLFRNDGTGRFKEVGTWSGCALDGNGAAQAGMGVTAGDATGDGLTDIVVTNFAQDFTTLYRALEGGAFEDASAHTGVGPPTFLPLSWGTVLADLDNDGDLDLAVANGHIYPQIDRHPQFVGTYAQRNLLLENAGPAVKTLFRDATAEAGPGFEEVKSSRGLAAGDYDNDGDLDLLLTHTDEPPSLLRNDSPGGAWLTVVCEGSRGLHPIGTTVTVRAGGRTQRRDIAAGDSFMSTHDPRPHFGLGEATVADEVDVRWPDGTHTVLKNVPARQFLRVRQSPH